MARIDKKKKVKDDYKIFEHKVLMAHDTFEITQPIVHLSDIMQEAEKSERLMAIDPEHDA